MFNPINFTQDSHAYGARVLRIGGGKSQKAPAPPDPVATARAQTESNVQTGVANAWLQNANQYTPYGNTEFTQSGTRQVGDQSVPTFNVNTTLNPADQALLDSGRAIGQQATDIGGTLLDRSAENLSQPMDFSGLPSLTQDFSADRRRVEDAFMGRFNEDFADREAATRQRLANQGIAEDTDASRGAFRPLNEARNDALTQAILAGGQEQSRLQGLAQGTRQQGIQEQAFTRSEPINALSGLFGLGPGVQQPTFAPIAGSGVAGTDVLGAHNAAYQAQMARYQQQQASRNAMMGGLGSLLGTGAGIAFSDKRLKKDVERVGKIDDLPLYRYHYKWQSADEPKHVGVMAHDVEAEKPEAVGSLFGMKYVDYSKITEG